MTQIPEWANWLARDKDGQLFAYTTIPIKGKIFPVWHSSDDSYKKVKETDDSFSHIKWEDTEPTPIETTTLYSNDEVVEIIRQAKKHEYDEIPEIETDTNKDMVNQPNHYIGEYGLEVEDVLRNFIPRYTDPYVGHRIASAIEYLLRSPLKNGQQDIEKARKNLDQALGYMEEKE